MFYYKCGWKISLHKFWSWYCKTWAFSKISLRALYQTFPLDQIHLPLIFVQVWHIFSVAFHFMFMILVVSTKTFTKFQTIPMKSEFLKIKKTSGFSLESILRLVFNSRWRSNLVFIHTLKCSWRRVLVCLSKSCNITSAHNAFMTSDSCKQLTVNTLVIFEFYKRLF